MGNLSVVGNIGLSKRVTSSFFAGKKLNRGLERYREARTLIADCKAGVIDVVIIGIQHFDEDCFKVMNAFTEINHNNPVIVLCNSYETEARIKTASIDRIFVLKVDREFENFSAILKRIEHDKNLKSRKHSREKVDVKSHMYHFGNKSKVKLIDLSNSGARLVHFGRFLKKGEQVFLDVPIEGGKKNYFITVEVVWSRIVLNAELTSYDHQEVGVRFKDLMQV